MSKMTGVLKCHAGYKIRWKLDDFKFLHNTISAYKNSPQILESDHFKMWDSNWKFKLTLEEELPDTCNSLAVNISLEVLDTEDWDKKGLSISADPKAIYKGGDESDNGYFCNTTDNCIEDFKIEYTEIFSLENISERIRHYFDFTWSIWIADEDVSSTQYKLQLSNAKKLKLMVNKWGGILDDTESHNVVLRCQGIEMTAHKHVLAGSSSVFKAMLQADMKESLESVVEVTVGTPETVKVMLRWIYNGEIGEKKPQALELLKLAHYYDLAGLMEECQVILVDTLCKENVIEMLNEADLMGAKELKDSAIQFIIRNKSEFKEDLEAKLKPKLIVELFLAR